MIPRIVRLASFTLLASACGGAVTVAAQTLSERNASHRVIEKLGFRVVATVQHPEDGEVLEWTRG